MEIVILPAPCCSDTCNGFGRESRKTGAKPRDVSKNLKVARREDARFLHSLVEGCRDRTGLIQFSIGGGSWASQRLESLPEEADLFGVNRSLAQPGQSLGGEACRPPSNRESEEASFQEGWGDCREGCLERLLVRFVTGARERRRRAHGRGHVFRHSVRLPHPTLGDRCQPACFPEEESEGQGVYPG